ncbi:hypothetical protein CAAN1_07S02454 [[Candida] anglica]|uniref:Uncharacterized protein n=1 Tax=[Candida] anglica TaxID=148631 RepID=A0ABP0EDS0_9ASCO
MATFKANDLALLLNIQTCFHQADILDRALEFNKKSPKTSIWVVIGITTSLVIQGFVAIQQIVGYMFVDQEDSKVKSNYQKLSNNFDLLNERYIRIEQELEDLTLKMNSETKNVQGRLNRGGDVRREIDLLSNSTKNLKESLDKVNYCLFSGKSITTALIPPSYNKSNDGTGIGIEIRSSSIVTGSASEFNDENKMSSPAEVWKSYDEKYKYSTSKVMNITDNQTNQNFETSNSNFVKSRSLKSSEINILPNDVIKSSFKESILKAINTNKMGKEVKKDATNIKEKDTKIVRYDELSRKDSSGRAYKRIFVPGRGWVPRKTIEIEEKKYGTTSEVEKRSP